MQAHTQQHQKGDRGFFPVYGREYRDTALPIDRWFLERSMLFLRLPRIAVPKRLGGFVVAVQALLSCHPLNPGSLSCSSICSSLPSLSTREVAGRVPVPRAPKRGPSPSLAHPILLHTAQTDNVITSSTLLILRPVPSSHSHSTTRHVLVNCPFSKSTLITTIVLGAIAGNISVQKSLQSRAEDRTTPTQAFSSLPPSLSGVTAATHRRRA